LALLSTFASRGTSDCFQSSPALDRMLRPHKQKGFKKLNRGEAQEGIKPKSIETA
jgi:hypothetical protein